MSLMFSPQETAEIIIASRYRQQELESLGRQVAAPVVTEASTSEQKVRLHEPSRGAAKFWIIWCENAMRQRQLRRAIPKRQHDRH